MQATMVPGSKHSTTLMRNSHISVFQDSGEYYDWHGEDNDDEGDIDFYYDEHDAGGGHKGTYKNDIDEANDDDADDHDDDDGDDYDDGGDDDDGDYDQEGAGQRV